ncbi:MAG: Cytochrome bo(3) ubiquinol oxidase subunit 2 [Porticoccaceae bacterium UBA1117]|nr:MAG: Cytochrome bo(3) ubiquinol oxidase subunit 2 [Porticoccaceae bacterium UBA1117]
MTSDFQNWLRLAILVAGCLLVSGCDEFMLFDPKGPVAEQQQWLIIVSFAIMLIVVIPVLIMSVWFPYKYRSGNTKEEYLPNWEHSNKIELVVWTVPILIITALGILTYITSHSLDPRKPIESDQPTMVVQVVAMDWKWLFIYPEYGIATVNEMAMVVDQPVEFLITSDATMNSFFIPNLGSMIYAMSGMENRLHLMASEAGTYKGMSTNYSGFGFSGMKFNAIASDKMQFDAWVTKVKDSPKVLTDDVFKALQVKSRDVKPLYFNNPNPLLFSDIIEHYTGGLNVE